MLLELHIKNFALIDSVSLEFSKGLNMLTGETGAGKSILIDSINFILGSKQNKDIIRTGSETAYVEGVFEVTNDEIIKNFEENGIENDEVLIVSREINQSGRTISRINGKTVTVGFIKTIAKLLIDIHGQHEHQSLLDDEKHIHILDSFCDEKLHNVKNEYKDVYIKVKEVEKKIEKLTEDEQYKLRRMDLLNFQIQEISDASLKINEDEELAKRKDVLVNAEKIYSNLSLVYQRLYESDERKCAYDEIGSSLGNLESIIKYDKKLQVIKSNLEEIYYKLSDVIEEVRDFKDTVEFNSDELNDIELRLDTINKLKRKYGSSIQEILSYYSKISIEFEQIEKSEEILNELNDKKEKYYDILHKLANTITNIRIQGAENLQFLIEKELHYLGMEKAIFKIEVTDTEILNEIGKNKVYFTMTANPGEPLRALSKVASGGEISRIMLAIKSVIADIDSIPTLIFDEIDTGISGRTAQAVAEKMVLISNNHQILCVSHLPQITSMADVHFKIQKSINNDKTTTVIKRLQDLEQVDELSRMISGAVLTELTRSNAREMLELAKALKSKIRK